MLFWTTRLSSPRSAEAQKRRSGGPGRAFRGRRMAPTLPAILVVGVLPTTITITGTAAYSSPGNNVFLMENSEEIEIFALLGSLVQRLFNAPRSSK